MSGKCGCAALREVLPATYGYVVLVAAGGHVLNLYLSKKVVDARKQYNVKYPAMYSEENDAFNCIQRAHQNWLEYVPFFYSSLLIGGLKFPRLAAGAGAVYLIGRVISSAGYSTGVPENRKAGNIPQRAGGMVLFGTMVMTGMAHSGLACKIKKMIRG